MSEHLRKQIRNEVLNYAESYEHALDSDRQAWLDDTTARIIALIRADERKRIREALLSNETVKAALMSKELSLWGALHGLVGSSHQMVMNTMTAALAAIGLTEEGADHE